VFAPVSLYSSSGSSTPGQNQVNGMQIDLHSFGRRSLPTLFILQINLTITRTHTEGQRTGLVSLSVGDQSTGVKLMESSCVFLRYLTRDRI
jgi:hypothetical protein